MLFLLNLELFIFGVKVIIIGWVMDWMIMFEDFGRFKGCRERKLLLLLLVFCIVCVV